MPSCCKRSEVVGTQINPRPIFRHEIDRFGRDDFGGHDQIAFVFAVGVIHDDDHFTRLKVGNN